MKGTRAEVLLLHVILHASVGVTCNIIHDIHYRRSGHKS